MKKSKHKALEHKMKGRGRGEKKGDRAAITGMLREGSKGKHDADSQGRKRREEGSLNRAER